MENNICSLFMERVLSTDKVNIRAFIKINDEIMEGLGHDSAPFKVSK